jgi:hypothetical protein
VTTFLSTSPGQRAATPTSQRRLGMGTSLPNNHHQKSRTFLMPTLERKKRNTQKFSSRPPVCPTFRNHFGTWKLQEFIPNRRIESFRTEEIDRVEGQGVRHWCIWISSAMHLRQLPNKSRCEASYYNTCPRVPPAYNNHVIRSKTPEVPNYCTS